MPRDVVVECLGEDLADESRGPKPGAIGDLTVAERRPAWDRRDDLQHAPNGLVIHGCMPRVTAELEAIPVQEHARKAPSHSKPAFP